MQTMLSKQSYVLLRKHAQIARHWKPMRTEFPRHLAEILTEAMQQATGRPGILGVESAEVISQPVPLFGTRICRTGHSQFFLPLLATLRLSSDPQGLLSQNYLILNTLKGRR